MHASRYLVALLFLDTLGFIPSSVLSQESSKSTAERLIVGKWRHIALVRVLDGQTLAPQHFNGDTIAEFRTDGTWTVLGPNTKSTGTYRWVGTDQIEQVIIDSSLAIQVGSITVKQVRVDAERLNLIVMQRKEDMAKFMPPSTPGVLRPNEVTVTTIFARVP
ncbi:hypothetical protein [Collimonas silvisoli]|uniref:hypothetical protein n=1 Tax=Collimonas silvisoli TaxID=2825884 RepID=UPI001B8C0143|nr:hypothetical protein [Collimonas silvisoli]